MWQAMLRCLKTLSALLRKRVTGPFQSSFLMKGARSLRISIFLTESRVATTGSIIGDEPKCRTSTSTEFSSTCRAQSLDQHQFAHDSEYHPYSAPARQSSSALSFALSPSAAACSYRSVVIISACKLLYPP